MIELRTSDLKGRKHVEIDGHGYSVRKLGAGEQLTFNQMARQISKLDSKSEADAEKAEAMTRQLLDLYAGLFDDGGDGSKSKQLVERLDFEELGELISQIFPKDTASEPAVS